MLLHLKIRDLAIIDELELELPPGFTVITGETGAGKSILVDALVVALGGRATGDLVRAGAASAEVEALFDIAQQPLVRARLEQRDLVGDDPDVLLIRRVVGPKGKAKVLINGFLSTVATLAEIVKGLVDISGQHEQLSLLDVDRHIEILDAFGDLDGAKGRYGEVHHRLRAVRHERAALARSGDENLKRADFLRFQLEEIERAAPKPGEDAELEVERRRLAHAEKLKAGAVVAEGLLYGEDGSAFDKLGKATAELEALAKIDPELASALEPLGGARREIEEVARVLQRYGDRIEADPQRLEVVEERLATLGRLCRKHGGSLADVLARRDVLAKELEGLGDVEGRLAELDAEAQKLEREALQLARELSAARAAAARRFDAAVLGEVTDMELSDAAFSTQVTPRKAASDDAVVDGVALGPSGADAVELLWSANKGEPLRSLAKIVSGGELSRLMLGVKRVLSSRDLVALYVFDEVDTGLGGKAADAIGRKLQAVARGHQAITITHLAPIASRADFHLRATKAVRGDRTVSSITAVNGAERAEEVARMIDGARITKATLEAARAMLDRSQRD